MGKSIVQLVDELPTSGMTITVLNALDFVVPGEWDNLIGFDRTIKTVTGEDDPGLISQIKDRAIELYNDEGEGYQRAVWLYQTVDTAASALGTAAMANKVGQDISFLGFLQNLTPKPEKAQAIDLGMKIVVELLAYCQINGIPGDSIGDFLGSLADYGGESKMRMAAMVCLDGLVPLGPNFIKAAGDWIGSATQSSLEENEAFRNIQKMIPGTDKVAFVGQAFNSVSSWMGNFVSDRGLSPQTILQHLQGFVDIADDKLDYVGAFLDMSTNYYYHTGVQTVAKRLIDRAYAEI
ncbi:hypothetical protein H6G52_05475 [Limnothrix sp. FACHB-881]|uniref:hypothetical protein n=1 Tax=unclassified Limnothrix TaxID=2632864 RepID=UPI0016805927|nr:MULTISPECIES: hypothetical protein [unclassified Limnothrix]MBD2161913.1 hypothetical protein [Limnothrix sp. FACHB-1083]MBD2192806.1 hypothetical protein [Limnothrix sp. FACHB-1088]MBD2553759.1 hypothetical protein [Limnothrix sp. FACHB-708]MBD2591230.1 hypothetical protein [Limnothrix sp. FACHB-406]MBD2634804.1 hypothetical protein [Limnothrix sp. FACHB-881]